MTDEQMVRMLHDRGEISDLAIRYALAWEDRDVQAVVETFTPDGVMDFSNIGTGCHEGREKIGAFVAENLTTMKASAHFTTNLLITEIVGDSASGSAYVFSRATHTNGETVDWMGRYADLYRRIDDKWLIANRRVFALLPDQSFPRPEI